MPISSLFFPLGALYAQTMRLREYLYHREVFKQWEPEVPCVSVGNISWGGTGKTPVCSWLLDWAEQRGLVPVLLTRGYKSSPPHLPFFVQADSSPKQAGDEPLLLAQNAPFAKIIVDPKRTRSGVWALQKFSPDLFVLDDGFQHLAVKRHINLVLFSPQDLITGWNKPIPAGTWREGKNALARADAFLVNTFSLNMQQLLPGIWRQLVPFKKPIFIFQVEASDLQQIGNQQATVAADVPYLLVTAIANPQKVVQTCVKLLGKKPLEHLIFSDHHFFSQKDVHTIAELAKQRQARILCTQKDAVKLAEFNLSDLWTLRTRIRFIHPSGTISFPDWFDQQWEKTVSAL